MKLTIGKRAWKIETKTGDTEPYPEWLALKSYGTRYEFVEREEAERVLEKLKRHQPHAQFRIAPI